MRKNFQAGYGFVYFWNSLLANLDGSLDTSATYAGFLGEFFGDAAGIGNPCADRRQGFFITTAAASVWSLAYLHSLPRPPLLELHDVRMRDRVGELGFASRCNVAS